MPCALQSRRVYTYTHANDRRVRTYIWRSYTYNIRRRRAYIYKYMYDTSMRACMQSSRDACRIILERMSNHIAHRSRSIHVYTATAPVTWKLKNIKNWINYTHMLVCGRARRPAAYTYVNYSELHCICSGMFGRTHVGPSCVGLRLRERRHVACLNVRVSSS